MTNYHKTTTDHPIIFSHPEFGNIRSVQKNGEQWFMASDVCKALGYRDASSALSDHVEPENKSAFSAGLRGKAPSFINEEGLYSLILGSHRPAAKDFKRWVLGTVLPAIRKHGAYISGAESLPEEAQANLYAVVRGQLEEALRRYDRLTQHDHWHTLQRRESRSLMAVETVSKEMGLPLGLVLSTAAQGVEAGIRQLTENTH